MPVQPLVSRRARVSRPSVHRRLAAALAAALLLGACASGYRTPGAAFRFDDGPAAGATAGGALLDFPAHLALVRVQAAGYRSFSAQAYGKGRFGVLAPAADATALSAIGHWSGVADVTTLDADALPPTFDSIEDLRFAAAKLGADVLLVYSIGTTFEIDGKAVPAQSLLKPGAPPAAPARLRAEASGQFIDVRSGLVNGAASGTASVDDLAASWSSAAALDARRLDAEHAAFQTLLADAQQRWTAIAAAGAH
ncbi:hypothetical protein [Solimonas soli]|uniref:hypothetical protein n=1 Tax=Solimonas soli TaxID=413479 RepID=UPI00047F0659|nr:hypothetical protein [Solimonas soli]